VRQTLETAVAIQAASTAAGVTVFEPILNARTRDPRQRLPGIFRVRRGFHRTVFELGGHGPTWRLSTGQIASDASASSNGRRGNVGRDAAAAPAIAAGHPGGDAAGVVEVVREHRPSS
jgi:hypothetical protein